MHSPQAVSQAYVLWLATPPGAHILKNLSSERFFFAYYNATSNPFSSSTTPCHLVGK